MSATWTGHWLPIFANYSQWLSGITLITAAAAFYVRRRCHVPKCWRLTWHVDPRHGHPVCKRHHPHSGVRADGSVIR